MNSDALGGSYGSGKSTGTASLGQALRQDVYSKLTAILLSSDEITDSRRRLHIQACCLDAISALEDLIERFGLDAARGSKTGF